MARFRRTVARIIIAWLSCQIAGATLLPATAPRDAECQCTHGADAACPMHHKRASGSKACVMQAVEGDTALAIASMVGIAGVLPAPVETAEPRSSLQRPAHRETQPISLAPVPPDPPPPRA